MCLRNPIAFEINHEQNSNRFKNKHVFYKKKQTQFVRVKSKYAIDIKFNLM